MMVPRMDIRAGIWGVSVVPKCHNYALGKKAWILYRDSIVVGYCAGFFTEDRII